MKTRNISIYIYILAANLASQPIAANEMERDYCLNRDNQIYLWGTGKKEAYDIAIRLSDPGLEGLKIKRISVVLPDDFIPTGCSGWITSELKLDENGENVADIASAPGVIDNSMLNIDFPDGIVIPREGVYAGYSFGIDKLDEAAKYPVSLGMGTDPDGFFIHSSRTFMQWKNESLQDGLISDMRITLEGDFRDFSIGLTDIGETFLTPDAEGNITATVVNHGLMTPSTISYTVTFADGSEYESSFVPEKPLLPNLEMRNEIRLPVKAPEATGTQKVKLTITDVDNTVNPDVATSISGPFTVMAFVPQRKVLMEEYTGLWCGACPRGYVALEEMNLRDPEEFVALSYHNSDQMAVFSPSDYPSEVAGFPAAFLNRFSKVDAYYGDTGDVPMGIEQTLEQYKKIFTPGEIEVSVRFADEECRVIEAESRSRFVFDREDAGISVAYMLVADNLHNDSWRQDSYYTDQPALIEESPVWEPFVNNSKVTGLVFNDVIVASPDLSGMEDSLPPSIISDTEYTNTCIFDTDKVVNLYGEHFINEDAMFKVVAVIIDNATGDVINCAKSRSISSGINTPESGKTVSAVEYYSLDGRSLESAQPGINICRTTYSDGSVTTRKLVIPAI